MPWRPGLVLPRARSLVVALSSALSGMVRFKTSGALASCWCCLAFARGGSAQLKGSESVVQSNDMDDDELTHRPPHVHKAHHHTHRLNSRALRSATIPALLITPFNLLICF
jgi:hypothetical protein